MVEGGGDLSSNFVELLRSDVEKGVGITQLFAGVLKLSSGLLADPKRPHEFEARQLARLVPLLQGRVHIQFWILDDLVTEPVNHHRNGVDPPSRS